MLFTFQLARGEWSGSVVESHQLTATDALASLRRMTHPGCIPSIRLRDVETCFIGEEMEHSPTNDEMVQAANTIASFFWRELHHRVDVTVEVLENN